MEAALKPYVVNAELAVSDTNPHSWLVLVGEQPDTPGPRCLVGTLRPEHRGRRASVAAFARAKLLVAADDGGGSWRSAAYRHEVLLPPGADDRYLCPQALFEDVDAAHPASGKALVSYVTLTWVPNRLHQQWSLVRALAAELVDAHAVPVLLIQHVPGIVASTALPHCHLLFPGPRTLSAIGWGGYVSALIGDRAWLPIRSRFHELLATSGQPVA